MKYQWREGARPPHKLVDGQPATVSADEVAFALRELPAPSPDELLEASKVSDHVLHWELWHEGDQVWAARGRLDRCRQIIGAVHEVTIVGGKSITVRNVEFVRNGKDGQWAHIETILKDPALDAAYLAEITRLLEQATAKLERYRTLKSS
jgi:hypothetical protein